MRENKAKQKLRTGGVASVISGSTMNGDLIDFLGQLGFDGAWIECEHGPVTWEHIGDLSRSCDLWGMTSLVRVPTNESWVITRTLDRGATGIVVPHVNTRQEAERVARSAKFGPLGKRGIYAGRQSFGTEDYYQKANDQTLVVILIEEVKAIENLAEILQVPHIDVFFVATGDLAQTMGFTGQRDHPEVMSVLKEAFKQITEAGRIAGANVSEQTIDWYLELGARFLFTQWDPWIAAGAKSFLAKVTRHPKSVTAKPQG